MDEIQHIVQFILDDKLVSIDFKKEKLSPTLTVLNYLRSLPTHKGVKEGCAEGDCGACTVVLAEIIDNKLHYKAINSCLVFLPMIHGKQLITVENLALKNGNEIQLHPVQEVLVELNGSQCGYCTPGIVMSMFALYKNHQNPTREIIEDTLTGNLCRCTGYQPILKAAEKVCKNQKADHFSDKEKEIIALLKSIQKKPIAIQTESQKYFQPNSINEVFHLLESYPDAVLVNGSTDIALKQTKKFELIKEVIDLSKVTEIQLFKESEDEISIGAGLSLESIQKEIGDKLPAFSDMLSVFASKQIREVATLGGNIGTASPIGDTLPLLMAYQTKINLISKSGKRRIKIEDFIKGYRTTDLRQGEIIHSIIIPKSQERQVKFYKISKRKDLDISTVSGGFGIELEKDIVKDICLVFGGMAEIPKRASKTEQFLRNKEWTFENAVEASKILYDEFAPISDARSGIEFRRLAAKNLLIKFYEETKTDYAKA